MLKRALNWLNGFYAFRFTAEVIRRFNQDQAAVLAGYISYASMLAAFPFLIFAMTLAGTIIGRTYSNEAFTALFDAVPGHVALTLEPVLRLPFKWLWMMPKSIKILLVT